MRGGLAAILLLGLLAACKPLNFDVIFAIQSIVIVTETEIDKPRPDQ